MLNLIGGSCAVSLLISLSFGSRPVARGSALVQMVSNAWLHWLMLLAMP